MAGTGLTYSPCHTPHLDLNAIAIAELKLEKRHTGRVLYARRVGDSRSVRGSVQYSIQDEILETTLILEFLAFPDESVLPQGACLAIKEPYLRGISYETAHLSVTHPSDIVVNADCSLNGRSTGKRLKTDREASLEEPPAIVEQEAYQLDFEAIIGNFSLENPRADISSYLKRTEPRPTENRGNGLFAKEDIKAGDIVLVEKSFCCLFSHEAARYDTSKKCEPHPERAALFKAIILKLYKNPDLMSLVESLHSDVPNQSRAPGTLGDQAAFFIDGLPVIDYFHTERIAALNAMAWQVPSKLGEKPFPFRPDYQGRGVSGSGIFVRAAYTNHDCVPNSAPSFVGDLLIFNATRTIKVGEEISISYFSDIDYQTRLQKLDKSWGFLCKCPLCTADENTGHETMRDRVYGRDQITEQELDESRGDDAIVLAEENVEEIEATYDDRLYADLPRPDLVNAYIHLARLYSKEGKFEEAEEAVYDALAAMNIKLVFEDEHVELEDCRRAVNTDAVTCLKFLSDCKRAKNEQKSASELETLAKDFYKMLNTTLHGWEQLEGLVYVPANAFSMSTKPENGLR